MIAIVIPTIRKTSYQQFCKAWGKLISKHNASLITVFDGKSPHLIHNKHKYTIAEIMGKDSDLIYNLNSGVRNLGFAFIAKFLPEISTILTLDDDVIPYQNNDPIQEHLDILDKKVPISWLSTASQFMRGFPYSVREEAEVVLSHGVWEGVKDYDAPTQLTCGNSEVSFYKGVVPKGIFFPMCIMNVAFKRKLLPFIYQAPMAIDNLNRFDDIWSGIRVKQEIDKQGWAAVTGYSTIYHQRASNVFVNLEKEAKGIRLNETFWQGDEADPYFSLYNQQYLRWQEFILKK